VGAVRKRLDCDRPRAAQQTILNW